MTSVLVDLLCMFSIISNTSRANRSGITASNDAPITLEQLIRTLRKLKDPKLKANGEGSPQVRLLVTAYRLALIVDTATAVKPTTRSAFY
ncbi:hypothetical protein DXG01_011492 [Tephrocybe rancida]|nr:hypothetical protein DXG01_011492 [Tephrocybe rancida]